MKNFFRAVRVALRHKWTFAGTVLCALSVALLWGGSISAVYPLVEVVLRGQTMPQWVDDRVDYVARTKGEFQQKVADLTAALKSDSPDDRRAAIAARLKELESRPPAQRDHVISNEIKEARALLAVDSPALQQREMESQLDAARERADAEQSDLMRLKRIQPWIHRYSPGDAFMTLLVIISFVLVSTLVKDVFLVGGAILVARLSQLTALELRREFFRRTLEMDVGSFARQGHGDLMSRFTGDMGAVAAGISTLLGGALREPLKMIACLIGAAIVSWRLLVLSLLIAPLAAWLVNRLSKSLKRANRRAMEEMASIYTRLSESLAGIKVVKAFTMEGYEQQRFDDSSRQYFRKSMKIARYDSLVSPLNELMGMAMISMAVLVGAYLSLSHETHLFGIKISDRRLSTGACILFYGMLAGVSDPARKLAGVFAGLQSAAAASDRVFAMMDRQPAVSDPPVPRPLSRHRQRIEFDKVHFAYQPGQMVLEDVSLDIACGETIALVGANGCGKSTLVNLVPRFFDPVQGSVRIDGIDLREVRQKDIRSQIGMVTQETLLFNDTVLQNIRYGSPDASHEAVIEAAAQAHADRFIRERLAEGYDTVVGPGGQKLSGGQRQRIALARAILRNPAILILDEATSQIDLESEQLIHQVLEQFRRNRTTLIITHRISTLALADRIAVMDHGRILDVGTHSELMARCGLYQRLRQVDLKATG